MLKKTIKFTDYNGMERVEDFYFNINKADIVRLDVSAGKEGIDSLVKRLTKEEDYEKILDIFEKIIAMSYGRKSEDGISFIKNKKETERFLQSEAYSELVAELFTDSKYAAEFITQVLSVKVPQVDIDEQIDKAEKELQEALTEEPKTITLGEVHVE